jgi:hypothetical protein
MSQPKNYYDYLKKYSPEHINRYENWWHAFLGRRSAFSHLQHFRAYIILTNHMTFLPGFRFKSHVFFIGALLCVVNLWGIWYSQEIYNKYSIHKWNHYSPQYHKDLFLDQKDYPHLDPTEEKKPFTRSTYSDRVKIIYDGEEQKDIVSLRRYRYR